MKIIDIVGYTPKREDVIFIDTNIWMYLFCPIGEYKKEIIKKYERFLEKLIKVNSKIFISSLTLSEFCNAYLRLEFNILKERESEKYKDFKKDYRGTDEYKNTVKVISATIRSQILKMTERINDGFETVDIVSILDSLNEVDFNDSYYHKIAETKNYKVLTDDLDFAAHNSNIELLTSNPRILSLQKHKN